MNFATASLDIDPEPNAPQEAPAEPLDSAAIEAWALEPQNLERARELGKRLITATDAKALLSLPSLGHFEDRASAWAADNQMKARLMLMRLFAKLAPTTT